MAGQIYDLAGFQTEVFDVVGIEKNHAAAARDAAVTVVGAVYRCVELVVRSDRGQQKLVVSKDELLHRVRRETGLA